MPDLVEVLRSALSLNLDDRAALAERLLASLDELDEEEAERLWAEEAQRALAGVPRRPRWGCGGSRRCKEGRKTLPMTPVRYHQAAEDELLNEIGYLGLRVPGLGRCFYAQVRPRLRDDHQSHSLPNKSMLQEVLPGMSRSIHLAEVSTGFSGASYYSIVKEMRLLILAVARADGRRLTVYGSRNRMSAQTRKRTASGAD